MKLRARIAIAVSALGASAVAAACVLADPPPLVTPPPAYPPAIVTDSVSPPLTAILRTMPPCTNSTTDCFVVPVRVDLNAAVKWRVFLDFDPTGVPTSSALDQGQDDGGVLGTGPDAAAVGIRNFPFDVTQSPNFDPTTCHSITFIVAYDFFPDDFSKPVPPGGSSVTWFYRPVDDCSFYDAGLVGDAGAE